MSEPKLEFTEDSNTGFYFNGKEWRYCENGKDVRAATTAEIIEYDLEGK